MKNGPETLRQQRPALTTNRNWSAIMANLPLSDEREIWKPIVRLFGVEASSAGRVRRAAFCTTSKRENQPFQTRPAKVIFGAVEQNGYRQVRLRFDGVAYRYLAHRLVCEAFHGPAPFAGATVDHLDGDRLNNRPENLQWVDRAENSRRQNAAGRGVPKGELHPGAKLSNEGAAAIRGRIASGERVVKIAESLGVSASIIYKIAQGKRRST